MHTCTRVLPQDVHIRGVARPGHNQAAARALGYFALPSAAFPAIKWRTSYKSVYSYFLQHKEVSQTSILGPVD